MITFSIRDGNDFLYYIITQILKAFEIFDAGWVNSL